LDLQTFSVMNVLLKGKMTALEKELQEFIRQENLLDTKSNVYRSQLTKMNHDVEGEILDLQIKVQQCDAEIFEQDQKFRQQVVIRDGLLAVAIDPTPLQRKLNELTTLKGTLAHKRNSAQQNIDFFGNNENCPMCQQSIAADHKSDMVGKCQHTVEEVTGGLAQLQNMIENTTNQINAAQTLQRDIQTANHWLKIHQNELNNIQLRRAGLVNQIEKLKQPTTTLASSQAELDAIEKELEFTRGIISQKKGQLDHYEVELGLLKDDGIKATILKKYIPIINQQVNAYLAAMNFFVGFEMDEVFEVTFKSRFRDKFKYEMFSEGQKARIDLALMLTWRDVAKLKNSVSTNLLVMDEVFDGSLDTEGSEELMGIFKALEGENVWVVSHKDLYIEKFDKVYKFVLENNFSQMVELK
jgi:DNA repair exonuclease SbcCD ATPase subunit